MANQEKYQLYDKGTRMWFQVTEEQYKAYRREQNAFRVKMMDHGRCTCPQCKWWLCDMTCMDCEYRVEKALSLDAPMADGDVCLADTIPDDRLRMEEEISDSDSAFSASCPCSLFCLSPAGRITSLLICRRG